MTTRFGLSLTSLVLVVTSACGGAPASAPPAAGASGGPPAMGVEIITLQAKPVEQTSEFVGTVKSRRSTTIQPQAEGFITDISVKSGDRVSPGAVLMKIDAKSQNAAIASMASVKAAREIDVEFARQEAQRAKTLLDAGAGSQQDYDRAANALKAAQAQVSMLDEQLQQQRTELAYYTVTAPTGGIVGDIPVRTGDRVTRTTVLTTVDDNAGLELYLSVPVQQASRLRIGLPVRFIDDSGAVIGNAAVSFVSPSVDDATQTVLVKVPVVAGAFRTAQYVRARVVWSVDAGLTVPITAVIRINSRYFAYAAESGPNGGLVARQHAVTLGPMVGNDYVLVDGFKAGDQLIVSGIQKIGDGAPVRAVPPATKAPGDK